VQLAVQQPSADFSNDSHETMQAPVVAGACADPRWWLREVAKILNGEDGIRSMGETTEKNATSKNPLHFPVQAGQPVGILDRELHFVVRRWPLLSDQVRSEICRLAAGESTVD
jgi:hypothetical protein